MNYFPWICLIGMIFCVGWILLDLWRLTAPERREKREKRASAQRLMELLALNREIPQPIKTVCSFCGQFMHGAATAELVSHGCCYRCRDINFADTLERVRPHTKPGHSAQADAPSSNAGVNSESAPVPPPIASNPLTSIS